MIRSHRLGGRLCKLAVKDRQRLAGSLQAHLARHHPVLQGSLGHNRAEPVMLLNELQWQERERAALQAAITAFTLEAVQTRLGGAAPVGAGGSDMDRSGGRP
jgi:hypothetical protein